jgi:hypothetical protein
MGCASSVATSDSYKTEKLNLSGGGGGVGGGSGGGGGGGGNKPVSVMRQLTFGSQSKFRFNLRTDHKIRDIARHYHELRPTLLWVDHNPNSDNKVDPICIFPFDTASNLLQSIEMAAAAKGVTVMRCSSSQEALSFLDSGPLREYRALPPSKFRIMSNRQRPEGQHMQLNPNAGISFAELSRQHG